MYIVRTIVAENQRAIEMLDGRYRGLLGPGKYTRIGWGRAPQFLIGSLDRPEVQLAGIDGLFRMHRTALETEILEVDLAANEVGLVRERGKLKRVLAPGTRQFYWKAAEPVSVERIDVSATAYVAPALLAQLRSAAGPELARDLIQAVSIVDIGAEQIGVLWIDGQLQPALAPGTYGFWRFARNVRVDVVDLRLADVEVGGQEILTRDKVSVRVNLSAVYRIVDALLSRQRVADVKSYVYRELQFGLRQSMGTRSLDAVLSDKGAVDEQVAEYARAKLAEVGVALVSVGVKDLILPGDMKAILNQVVEAEKQAQANLIKRREETAATRSLLNTARLLDEIPALMRLKEFETLEKIAESVGHLNVLGGLGELMEMLPKPLATR